MASRGGSSTSARPPSRRSPRSPKGSPTSSSPGSPPPAAATEMRGGSGGLTPSAVRALAARHGIRPRRSLGQHFLIEPALARRIAELSGAKAGTRVLEIGAGLGSLTVALARTGADVLAMEVDPRLIPALREAVSGFER